MTEASIDELLRAAGAGELDPVRRLIATGADVNAANEIGYTPLMSAARSYRTAVVRLLLEQGANPNAVCSDGITALHAAVGETPSLSEAQVECVRYLVEAGADVDARTNAGLTPLMNAVWFGCTQSVAELLAAGASLLTRDHQGRTAEDLAKARKREEILKLIATTKNA